MNLLEYDIYRYYGKYEETFLEKIKRPNCLKYLRLYRKISESNNNFLKIYYKYKLNKISRKTFIQIPCGTKIGKGFYIGHNGPVIINPNATIGDNCNIATGVTIGQENRGERKGSPIIGNEVWIGANSVIVGNIKIGSDVLIAPLSYVNFNVPDHSIVIGNPAKIIHKKTQLKVILIERYKLYAKN